MSGVPLHERTRRGALRGGFPAFPLFEQPRDVAGDGVERRRPAERTGARAADELIQRQRVGIRAHLLARLRQRHVPDARLRVGVIPERREFLGRGEVPFVPGVRS